MQKINLIDINIEGFRSFVEPTLFKFNDDGLYILRGSNGSGKTTLVEAIYWALTGDNLKGSNQAELISEGESEARVILRLTCNNDDVVVDRSIGKSSRLHVYINSDIDKGLHLKDQQARLYALLGVDSKIIQNTIIFGQRMTRLIESSNDDKRKLFEELFEIDFIDSAKEVARDMYNDIEEQIETIESQNLENLNRIDNCNMIIRHVSEQIETFELAKERDLAEAEQELTRWKHRKETSNKPPKPRKVAEPKPYKGQFINLQQELADAKTVYMEVKRKWQDAIERVEEHESEDCCPECGQPYADHGEIMTKLEEREREALLKHDELYTTVMDVQKKLDDTRDGYEKYQERVEKYAQYQRDMERYDILLEQYNNTQALLEDEIKRAQEKIQTISDRKPPEDTRPNVRKNIESLEASIAANEDKAEELMHAKQRVEWWSKQAFGSNGIKAYVFAYMIDQLNQSINKYADRLGIAIQFDISLSGKMKRFNTITRIGERVRPYTSLSGGEKTRVDLAIAFGMFDLLRGNKLSSNVLFLDEAFENLDNAGVDEAFDLIRVMSQGSAVYVITHQEIDALYAQSYEFKKVGGVTHISR